MWLLQRDAPLVGLEFALQNVQAQPAGSPGFGIDPCLSWARGLLSEYHHVVGQADLIDFEILSLTWEKVMFAGGHPEASFQQGALSKPWDFH